MIVNFEWPIKTLSGKNSEGTLVYQSCRDDSICIARLYSYPRITEHNHRQGTKLQRASILYKAMNEVFKEDLKRYADAFKNQLCLEKKLPPNFYNIFTKALCNGSVKIEDLDSLERFVGLFGNNIEDWIANGLLPKVKAKFLGVEVWVTEEKEETEGFIEGVKETKREFKEENVQCRTDEGDEYPHYLVKGARFEGKYDLPCLPQIRAIPSELTEFQRLKKPDEENQYIHFYLADKKFECVYRNPYQSLERFQKFGGINGFDYSVYIDYPVHMQIANYDKNKALSFWYITQGMNVIPNVRWGKRDTFDWCCDGLPKQSTVAVSTLGYSKTVYEKWLFVEGFFEMIDRLEPTAIVVYGTQCDDLIPAILTCNKKLVFFESKYTVFHRKETA